MKFSLRSCLSATLALCLGGFAHFYLQASVPGEAPAAAANPAKFTPVVVQNEATEAKADIQKRAIALLQAGDFDSLDAIAREFRASQVIFADGGRPLNLFYQALHLDESAPEDEWAPRLGLLRHWFEADVESVTARVAMADALVMYAWHARGTEWARDVKQDAWRIVSERVTEAHRILEAARTLPEKCPYWYTVWMTKAMLSSEDQQRYDEVFDEALREFPSYTTIYLMKTWRLEEKWFGKRGDWEAFATESADRLGGEDGDILYARIVWRVHDHRTYGNPVAESAMDWARARRGFEAIRRQYPDSLLALSEFCSISGFAPKGARRLMRELFDELGNRVDLRTWKNVDLFLRDRRWAYSLQ
jgi:hypothetical protein